MKRFLPPFPQKQHRLTVLSIALSVITALILTIPHTIAIFFFSTLNTLFTILSIILLLTAAAQWFFFKPKTLSRQTDISVKYQGKTFKAWFFAHNYSWMVLFTLFIFLLTLQSGPNPFVIILCAGAIACVLFLLTGTLVTTRSNMLGICWKSPIPENSPDFWSQAGASLILKERYNQSIQLDQNQPTPLLWSLYRIFDRSETTTLNRKLELMPQSIPSTKLRSESFYRFKILSVVFIITSILAAIPALLGYNPIDWAHVPGNWFHEKTTIPGKSNSNNPGQNENGSPNQSGSNQSNPNSSSSSNPQMNKDSGNQPNSESGNNQNDSKGNQNSTNNKNEEQQNKNASSENSSEQGGKGGKENTENQDSQKGNNENKNNTPKDLNNPKNTGSTGKPSSEQTENSSKTANGSNTGSKSSQDQSNGKGEGKNSDSEQSKSPGNTEKGEKGPKADGAGGTGQGMGDKNDKPKMSSEPTPMASLPSRNTKMVSLELPELKSTSSEPNENQQETKEKKNDKLTPQKKAPTTEFKKGKQDPALSSPDQYLPNWILILLQSNTGQK